MTDMLRFVAGLLLLFWILYKVLYKFLLSVFLSWMHIILTMMASILIVTFNIWSEQIYSTNDTVYSNDFKQFERYNTILSIITIGLIGGQFIFLINLIGGLT